MKVALVHDYLKEYGGAERVLEALHELFPQAPVYTSYYNPDGLGSHKENFKNWDIRPSWFQKIPFASKQLSLFRVFAPFMFESFDLKEYDLIISSCAMYFSKAVITKPGALHISYIHTPPRYLYGYQTSFNYKRHWWTRIGGEALNHFLRIYDYETSQRPDILVTNSKNVASRIKKFYRRDAIVIYPPVELSDKNKKKSNDQRLKTDNYFLSVSRLVRGKGLDVIISACLQLGLPLKVVGSGPELKNLKSLILNHKSADRDLSLKIEFLDRVPDAELAGIYANAKALIVAAEDEDFGITAVEAQCAGTPVIAPRAGGYLETVVEGKTGVFYDKIDAPNLSRVLSEFQPNQYLSKDCKHQAEKFSSARFKNEVTKLINSFFKGAPDQNRQEDETHAKSHKQSRDVHTFAQKSQK